ncbi:MAG: hypothetical protein R6V75_09600 [Bacteroidales bacterium]
MTAQGFIVLSLLILHWQAVSAHTQPDTLRRWEGRYDQVACDPAGNIYLARGAALVKYGPAGDSLYSWSDPESGRISRADAGDPFRILVYQPDFNRLRLLNNRLAPLSPVIHVDDLGITNPLALCSSRQGGLWILDGNSLRINYFDQHHHLISESAPCPLGEEPVTGPISLLEQADRLYLHLPGREILVFDLFGNLIRKIPLQATSLDADGQRLMLATGSRVVSWKDPVEPVATLAEIPGEAILQAVRCRSNLLVRLDNRVLLIRGK